MQNSQPIQNSIHPMQPIQLSIKHQQISGSPILAIDARFKEMKATGEDVLGFGAGEPDFDTPQNIKDAAIKAIGEGQTKYTAASGTPSLKKAICDKLKSDNDLDYKPNQIVVSGGAKHSLMNTFLAILNPGDEVIIPVPFWVSYPEMVKLADGTPIFLETSEKNRFKFTASELESKLTTRTKAVIINSPSNPTGMVYTEDELRDIASLAVKHNFFIISDEIYEKLIYSGTHVSIASFLPQSHVIVINGVSKSHSMTGWRIGYTASSAEIANIMSNVQSHATSNPSSVSQAAALEALSGNQDSVEIMRKEFEKRRNFLVSGLNNIDGISCLIPDGAFYAFSNAKGALGSQTSLEFCEKLLEKEKVALVPGEGFGAPGYIRWSYATSMENIAEGLERLKRFVSRS